MKVTQIYITTALGVICLVLSIATQQINRGNQALQARAQAQQAEITKGNQVNQVGLKLLNEMARLSLQNEKIKTVLEENNFSVQPIEPTPAP